MTHPGLRLAVRATGTWVLLVCVLLPALLVVSSAEAGDRPVLGVLELLRVLGPICAAVAMAWSVAASRIEGSWDGWTALGVPVRTRLGPLALAALLGAMSLSGLVFQPQSGPDTLSVLVLPAPVSPQAVFWPENGGWSRPDLSRWQVPPGDLSTSRLVERASSACPSGARRGVDLAEIIVRMSLAMAWLVAVPFASLAALRRTAPSCRRVGAAGLAACFESAVLVLVWQAMGLVVAAYASSMM